jgi:hypothetical protein
MSEVLTAVKLSIDDDLGCDSVDLTVGTNVSEEDTASIFRAKVLEEARSSKTVPHGVTTHKSTVDLLFANCEAIITFQLQ